MGQQCKTSEVFIYSIANFSTFRCLEQIRNDISYHDLNVTVVSVGGGFNYGSLGMSHHATEDISIMRSMPGMEVCVPATKADAIETTKYFVNSAKPGYLRIDKSDYVLKLTNQTSSLEKQSSK